MPEQMVFVDESACNRKMTYREYAWAVRGRRAVRKAFFIRGKRSVIIMTHEPMLVDSHHGHGLDTRSSLDCHWMESLLLILSRGHSQLPSSLDLLMACSTA